MTHFHVWTAAYSPESARGQRKESGKETSSGVPAGA